MPDIRIIQRFVRRRFGIARPADIEVSPLCGGLESEGIACVTVWGGGENSGCRFVVKPLSGPAVREAAVHRTLGRALPDGPVPELLGWESAGPDEGYLFIEWVERTSSWPWTHPSCAALVLDSMADIHNSGALLPASAATWDYEAELRISARSTVELYMDVWRNGQRPAARAMVRTLERVTEALPEMRTQLMAYTGTALLHGDVHPGNAIITESRTGPRAVLLDWGRARSGSPLEDVSSWLQTLAFWEPEARRSHDTLFRWYLDRADWAEGLSRKLRDAYWLAGACNAMAGALRYHMAVTLDEERTDMERAQSRAAAADWLRILRRADVCWRA
jgi:aminoglycoside phosphotransferase (APT) family kinase protein